MFPAPYETFISLFNAQRFWDAHEVLEGPWRRNRSRFYKGLIIYASAFVHLQRGNPVGIGKQMRKVLHYLPPFEPCYMGLDVSAITAHAETCCRAVAGREGLRGDVEALMQLIPIPRLSLEVGYVRGDEPELQSEKEGTDDG